MKLKKSSKIIFTISAVLFIIILNASILVGCSILGNNIPLRGNLFDKNVLKRYELSWLEKPQNVTNERQNVDSERYEYKCEINSIEEFEEYVEKVFNGFKEKNYTIAHWHSVSDIGNPFAGPYDYVVASNELSDFCKAYDDSVGYTFYYSTKKIQEMKSSSLGGREIGSRKLYLTFVQDKLKSRKYEMNIYLYGIEQTQSNIIYED